ncbi:MAG: deoxyguanosinetriphosphate triphosphohydrolase [Hyphomicrobiales bacterium]
MTGDPKRSLAAYACDAGASRGRFVEEPETAQRSVFQRDRDRIVHSTAFRRLKHKTQVFVYHEGDHFRTRLTHSLEVAQVARALSRTLALDEDLTEALALAHDLGHTPFGHAGETALDRCMRSHGGFDHNAQSLRIVTRLERRYAQFDGLNLTWETLEGLVKHNGPLVGPDGNPIGAYAETGLPEAISDFAGSADLRLDSFASAEAQVAALSDDIAYNAHDIDDGLRAGLFDIIDLGDVPLAGDALGEVLKLYPDLERPRLVHETVRRLISRMVNDVLEETGRRLEAHEPASPDDIRALDRPVVALSGKMTEASGTLKAFLFERMYRHERVLDVMARAQRIICDLYEAFSADTDALPPEWRPTAKTMSETKRARHICDFIAGMTDRYAMEQHKRLFDVDPLFR